jgi:4-hydroxy-3-methylbut-2-enyl diphosphate reductase
MSAVDEGLHRKGLGLKTLARRELESHYASDLLLRIRESGGRMTRGNLTVVLAREYGFCYGVERTIQYAYETRIKFPDRRIFVTDEVIHNPHVNQKLVTLGMEFLKGRYRRWACFDDLTPEDVVIIPAFGVTVEELELLRSKGSILVDTTCGSVLNVWKNVERYARSGFTAIIHGKYWHEETRATASQVSKYAGGRAIVVLNMEEARRICDYIGRGGDRAEFLRRFGKAVSDGFDPDRDLARVGVANQTTMLAAESRAIEAAVREAVVARWGAAALADHFMEFDTICSATQERQDAIHEMLKEPLDLVVLIGGFNSSNTSHLAEIAAERYPTYFIENAEDLRSGDEIRCRAIHAPDVEVRRGWLPRGRPVTVGVTAGASTPNNVIGGVIERLFELRGPGA